LLPFMFLSCLILSDSLNSSFILSLLAIFSGPLFFLAISYVLLFLLSF
jgi:hypothetical protein